MMVFHKHTFFTIAGTTCLLLVAGICLPGAHSYQTPATQQQYGNDNGNEPLQSQPFFSSSTHFEDEPEHEFIEDSQDDGGRVKLSSSTFVVNGQFHRGTTQAPRRPYFGRSSTRSGNTNYVPTVYHGIDPTTASNSETAIRFPGMNTSIVTTAASSPGMIARGGIHGGNHRHHGAHRGKIPLNLLRKLSNEHDVTQVFAKYVSNVKIEDVNGQKQIVTLQGTPLNIQVAGGGAPTAVIQPSGGETTKPKITPFADRKQQSPAAQKITSYAGCEPELQTVELPAPNDPSVVQYPRCVRLQRCGGCCASDLLSCESIMRDTTQVQVQKFSYNDESEKLEYKETEIVSMSVDLSCRCNCKVKSHDCTARHEYSSEDCACVCKNKRENEVCLRQPHKLWDPNLCQCICREILPCSSGYSFDLDTCQCTRIPEDRFGSSTGTTRAKRRLTHDMGMDTSAALRPRN